MPKIIVTKKNIKLNTDFGALKIYPTIENLTVTPSSIEQVFTHPGIYGYDTVTVEAIEADTLNITPTTSSQEYVGLYGTVNVSAVDSSIALFSTEGRCYFESIIFPNNTKSIGSGAYAYCNQLKQIIIPNHITSIGTTAFRNTSLLNIDLTAYTDPDTILTLGNVNAFNNTPDNKIFYVANQEMYDAFTTATNWSTFINNFQIKRS